MQNSPRRVPEVMPTKERYERDKAYYHEWNTSDKGKAADYAEMAGYSPSEIGFVKVIVKDKQIVDVQKTVV